MSLRATVSAAALIAAAGLATSAHAQIAQAQTAQAQTANVTPANVNVLNLLGPFLSLNGSQVGQSTPSLNLSQAIAQNNGAMLAQQQLASGRGRRGSADLERRAVEPDGGPDHRAP